MGIKICPECKGKVSENRLDCPHCGYIFNDGINKVLCPDCGEMVIVSVNNECPECGHVFDSGFNPFQHLTPIEEPSIFEIQMLPTGKKKLIKCTDEYAEKVEIPNGVVIIGKEAFKGLQYLKEVKLSDSVTIIDDEAFANCPKLEIELPKNIDIGKDVIVGTLTEKKIQVRNKLLQELKSGVITFGTYPQGENGEVQPIEWKVLETDGTSALLISKYALDCKQYHNNSDEDITWEKCDLRNWLNTTFINIAFTKEEQDKIKLSEVTADINPVWNDSPQGNNTKDKIFLLSINEINKYFSSNSQREVKATPYCYNQGAWKCEITEYKNNCAWWLRSSGEDTNYAVYVIVDGTVNFDGYYVDSYGNVVCPALRINL